MRMAGDEINLLSRLLGGEKLLVDRRAGAFAVGGLIHAVVATKAMRERGMTAEDDRGDRRILHVGVDPFLDPFLLCAIEGVIDGIVDADEIDAVRRPMV